MVWSYSTAVCLNFCLLFALLILNLVTFQNHSGGRRDPEDESDLATAKRETLEEVGIDLDKHAGYVGPLKQRYVTTYWGGKMYA